MICIQKIYGFHGINRQNIEKSWYVTPVTEDGRTEDGGKWKIGQCSVGPETAILQFHSREKGKAQVWWSSEALKNDALTPVSVLELDCKITTLFAGLIQWSSIDYLQKMLQQCTCIAKSKVEMKNAKVVTWQLAKGKPQEPPALILGLKHMHCPPLKSICCQFCWVLVFVHSFLSTCSKVRGAIEGRGFCFWSPANLVPCFRLYTLVTGDVPQSEMTYSS